MIRKKRKVALVAAGFLYILFGILAFFNIPGGHDEHHHSFAHNLTHIILGIVLLAFALRCPARIRQIVCFSFAAAYVVIGSYGFVAGKTAEIKIVPNVIEFHAGDYAVHLSTALLFLVLGFLKRSDKKPQA